MFGSNFPPVLQRDKKPSAYIVNSPVNNKSSGNDGLTKEFYVCFLNIFSDLLMLSMNLALSRSILSSSQRQALMEKKGRDKRLIRNWRPFSLINVDVKIISGCLALRVKNAISRLVSSDKQHISMADILERVYVNVRLIDDILE